MPVTLTAHQAERMRAHACPVHHDYVPEPERHLANPRDCAHFQEAQRFMEQTGSTTVLDVGSFDSWLDFLLIKAGYVATGVELIPELAHAARRYANRNFINYHVHTGFAAEIDFFPRQFDAVICFETLEHMRIRDAITLVQKFETWAKRGVLVSLPNQSHEQNHQHLWTPGSDANSLVCPGYESKYTEYPGCDIPGNWFLSKEDLCR